MSRIRSVGVLLLTTAAVTAVFFWTTAIRPIAHEQGAMSSAPHSKLQASRPHDDDGPRLSPMEVGKRKAATSPPSPVDETASETHTDPEPGRETGSDYSSFIADRLAMDAADPVDGQAVAAALEQSVLNMLEGHSIEGAVLLGNRCGWTLCGFTLSFDSAESAGRGANLVAFGIPWDGDGYYHMSAEDESELVVYVAREGEALPSP